MFRLAEFQVGQGGDLTTTQDDIDEAQRKLNTWGAGNVSSRDIREIHIGRVFQWQIATTPYVKRSQEGSNFSMKTRTTQIHCNCLRKKEFADIWSTRAGRRVDYLVNGATGEDVPQVWTRDYPKQVDSNLFRLFYRHLSFIGWRKENVADLRGHSQITITSIQRTLRG